MLPIYMTQRQEFWPQGMPTGNTLLFSGFVPTRDTARPLSRIFPANWGLVLTFQCASSPSGKFCPSVGLLSALWPGSTTPAVFPKTTKYLSILLKPFVSSLLFTLYSNAFNLLVQLLNYRWKFSDRPGSGEGGENNFLFKKSVVYWVRRAPFYGKKVILL